MIELFPCLISPRLLLVWRYIIAVFRDTRMHWVHWIPLQMVSHHVVTGDGTWDLCKSSALNPLSHLYRPLLIYCFNDSMSLVNTSVFKLFTSWFKFGRSYMSRNLSVYFNFSSVAECRF